MSSWADLQNAQTAAAAALQAARDEIQAARDQVAAAVADVNTAVLNRVQSRDPSTPVPLTGLSSALDALSAVEAKYQIPPASNS